MMYRLTNNDQPILENFVCKETQRTHNQTTGSPTLSARANDTIYLMYLENGHVTRLESNRSSGFITVFGTSNPSSTDTFQSIGEAKGDDITGLHRLYNFDDEHCYEDNESPIANERKQKPHRPQLEVEGCNLWCGNRVPLPKELMPGTTYTLYWVWNYSTRRDIEIYTTCLDIDII